jgi:hypothetical protein
MVPDRSPLRLDKEVSHAAWLAVCQLRRIMALRKNALHGLVAQA